MVEAAAAVVDMRRTRMPWRSDGVHVLATG